jgi:hypothetical protein
LGKHSFHGRSFRWNLIYARLAELSPII